jgi:hypothetical protein
MNRHDLDTTSLVAGVVFGVVGLLSLLKGLDAVDFNHVWLWPILLIGFGLAGLLVALRPDDPRRPEPDESGDYS